MSDTRPLAQLGSLIAVQHGWPAAKAFKAYVATDADMALFARKAVELLRILPVACKSAALISAGLAAYLDRDMTAPIQVVVGTLIIKGEIVRPAQRPAIAANDQQSWGGHVWLMIGPHLVDAAIFRIARSPTCPSGIARHIYQSFGPDQALLFDRWSHIRRLGLDYRPHQVLGTGQVDALVREAHALIAGQSTGLPADAQMVSAS